VPDWSLSYDQGFTAFELSLEELIHWVAKWRMAPLAGGASMHEGKRLELSKTEESLEVLLSHCQPSQNESLWIGIVINGEYKRSQYYRLIRIRTHSHLKKCLAHSLILVCSL
jgi:hypothetical protein